jgi:NAD(P)-dependent dehydrogenase (short-subunit alcohol dehydrogenase family)
VQAELGTPRLVVYNAATFSRGGLIETSAEEFETGWRVGCMAGFLVARAAARRLLAASTSGTIIFTGNTASVRGGAQFHTVASGKFALRGLAQSLLRELQPRGVHVAHVVIDGLIADDQCRPARGPDAFIEPDSIAETYYQIHRQPRNAWTGEIDLRTWMETSGEIAEVLRV